MNAAPTTVVPPPPTDEDWPTHLDLPCEDGVPVNNNLELPQSMLLTSAFAPVARRLYPGGDFLIGQDLGIYWRRLKVPPFGRAVAPDWFFVGGVPVLKDGEPRRSYVLWYEEVMPLVVLEYASGDGREERDDTPHEGKFWIYEQRVRAAYYGIWRYDPGVIEVYKLDGAHYRPQAANAAGHFAIPELDVALGVWRGRAGEMEMPWMRWYSLDGTLLPTDGERADALRERLDGERLAKEKLAAKLRELGIDPDTL